MAQAPNWELYRYSTVGLALLDTVDEMVRSGAVDGDIANIIMARFDDAIGVALRKKVDSKCSFSARCSTFNLVDEVYKFTLKDVKFKMEGGEHVLVPSLKVISCKSGVIDEPSAASAPKTGKGKRKTGH